MTRNNATEINLPGSKSISNRALILAYLHGMPLENIQGLSDSRDTQLLKNAISLLESESTSRPITPDISVALPIFDFMDAGTPSRFFLALCTSLGHACIITGNESLENRSIEDLVNVLSFGGCEIQYLNQPGFFPVQLLRREHSLEIATNPLKIAINRSISSQFVSAIMLISCRLINENKENSNSIIAATSEKNRVEIELLGHAHSDSYIEMTASVMRDFGYQVEIKNDFISISGDYNGIQEYTIESDWSSVSYFLNRLLLEETVSEISFKHLKSDSYQGDRKMISFYEELGLEFEFHSDQLLARKKSVSCRNTGFTPTQNSNTDIGINPMDLTDPNAGFTPTVDSQSGSTLPSHIDFDWDLGDIPDTVPSLVVALAALKKSAYLRNIHNLIYKESNRIAVLNENLIRFGFQLIQDEQAPNNYWLISNSRHWRSEKQEFVVLNNPDKHTDTNTVNFEKSHGTLKNDVLKTEQTDPIKIQPYKTHSDHRMAMAFASITKLTEFNTHNADFEHELISNWVDDPSCVEKSFPNFWQELQKMVG